MFMSNLLHANIIYILQGAGWGNLTIALGALWVPWALWATGQEETKVPTLDMLKIDTLYVLKLDTLDRGFTTCRQGVPQ